MSSLFVLWLVKYIFSFAVAAIAGFIVGHYVPVVLYYTGIYVLLIINYAYHLDIVV